MSDALAVPPLCCSVCCVNPLLFHFTFASGMYVCFLAHFSVTQPVTFLFHPCTITCTTHIHTLYFSISAVFTFHPSANKGQSVAAVTCWLWKHWLHAGYLPAAGCVAKKVCLHRWRDFADWECLPHVPYWDSQGTGTVVCRGVRVCFEAQLKHFWHYCPDRVALCISYFRPAIDKVCWQMWQLTAVCSCPLFPVSPLPPEASIVSHSHSVWALHSSSPLILHVFHSSVPPHHPTPSLVTPCLLLSTLFTFLSPLVTPCHPLSSLVFPHHPSSPITIPHPPLSLPYRGTWIHCTLWRA